MQQIPWKCRCGKSHQINAELDGTGAQLSLMICIGCGEPYQLRPQGALHLQWSTVVQLLKDEHEQLRQYTRVRAILRSAN